MQDSRSQLTEESQAFEKLSDELREVVKALTLLLNNRMEGGKPSYWTRVTKTINKVFFIFYVIAAGVFLLCMSLSWNNTLD